MSSSHECNHLLVNQANESAKRMAFHWIRSVFRQVSVQTLQQLWTTTNKDDFTELHITNENLKVCDETCQRLGTFWCQRLRDAGHIQVAEWVRDVMERKRFWEPDNVVLGKEISLNNKETSRIMNEASSDDKKTPIEPLPLPASGNKLILTKIRRLGERKVGEEPPSIERVSRTLDELGRSGQTDWPLDWNIIEEAARTNFKRLHSETIKGRPLNKASNENYEVVPKSLVEREQQEKASQNVATENQQEIDAIKASRGRLVMMMERKRKAASEPNEETRVTRLPLSPPIETYARAPSSIGNHERWSWKDDVVASLSEQGREQLERAMIHNPPDDDESATELHSIMGALKDVGSYQMYLQNSEDNDNVKEMSAQKRQRLERKVKKQRLFPRQVKKVDRESKKAVTKVVRTVDGNDQHWMELDLGECLVDIVEPESSQKKLCAFSSLEVTLKDEDETNDPVQS